MVFLIPVVRVPCEDLLRRWLSRYVLSSDDASPEMMVRYPLREAAVSVRERPGQPGSYASTIHLRPHFQLDQMVSSFKLVTELPGPAA